MLSLIQTLNHGTIQIKTYSCGSKAPVIWFNCPVADTNSLIPFLDKNISVPFHLIFISGMVWDDALTPWPMGPTAPGDQPCAGKADEYLKFLESIQPQAEQNLDTDGRIIAGYSLSGLFAYYSLYKTSLFDKACSMSGSLWYPDFVHFATTHSFVSRPQAIFFSLGKEEAKSPNPYFRTVQVCTQQIYEYVESLKIPCCFILEPGNHFQHFEQRVVRGFQWILTN